MKIESLQNAKVKEWCKLKEKKYRDKTSLFLIEGDHLLKEALKYGVVKEIITTNNRFLEQNIPCYETTDVVMRKISSQVSGTNVIAVCQKKEPKDIVGQVCMLDDIQDPGNLGTIIRSAVAFQIDTIILGEHSVDLYNEKVIRASEGMIFKINILRGSLENYCLQLQKKEYKIFGTSVVNGIKLQDAPFSSQNCIIIGNEGQGMKESLKEYCENYIYIPMCTQCESLNAGVSASIIFYEMERR